MRETSAISVEPTSAVHDRWARVYDSQPNPMLSLETRYLRAVLPDVQDKDVIDLGCGTGRWLTWFCKNRARSVLGVDASLSMLEVARTKGLDCKLLHSNCESAEFENTSTDLVLASFLQSYLSDIRRFASVLKNAIRSNGSVFLSDVHPQTLVKFGWKRGFTGEGRFEEVSTQQRSVDEIVAAFQEAGFRLRLCLEPSFGREEHDIFSAAGKQKEFLQFQNSPAIVLLQFDTDLAKENSGEKSASGPECIVVRNARIGLGASEMVLANLEIDSGYISFLGAIPEFEQTSGSEIDLSGYAILPGLINAHDHLEFALFPRLGAGGYQNCGEWAADIHERDKGIIELHRKVPKNVRMWWGAIRNALCGVTTVCHHNPYCELFDGEFPVRVVKEFDWAHSLTFDANLAGKSKSETCYGPFVVHLGEGVDERSANEIVYLKNLGALTERTVIIHGIALNDEGMDLLTEAGGGLIWCPSSNDFLFGKTISREVIQRLNRLALGSDSSLTSVGDLLDECRFAATRFGLNDAKSFELVTDAARDLLRLRREEGRIRVGGVADFLAVEGRGETPAALLRKLSWKDVQLVVLGGKIQVASEKLFENLPSKMKSGMECLAVNGTLRWVRAPIQQLMTETKKILGNDIRLNGRPVSYGPVC